MKKMLQREQQTKLECVHALDIACNTRQKHTLVCKVLTEKRESSCPQPVPLGNLVASKQQKDFFTTGTTSTSL